MTEEVSKSKLFLARLVVVLMVAFVVVGMAKYGLSAEVFARIWHNLLERASGPMTFRFILQPIMATIAAFLDGLKDARTGRAPFLATVLTNPTKRAGRLQEAVLATARIAFGRRARSLSPADEEAIRALFADTAGERRG